MCHVTDSLGPVVILIEDESSALSDEEVARQTSELLDALGSRPLLELPDVDIAAIIHADRKDERS